MLPIAIAAREISFMKTAAPPRNQNHNITGHAISDDADSIVGDCISHGLKPALRLFGRGGGRLGRPGSYRPRVSSLLVFRGSQSGCGWMLMAKPKLRQFGGVARYG